MDLMGKLRPRESALGAIKDLVPRDIRREGVVLEHHIREDASNAAWRWWRLCPVC
jgi:hypothetical protein